MLILYKIFVTYTCYDFFVRSNIFGPFVRYIRWILSSPATAKKSAKQQGKKLCRNTQETPHGSKSKAGGIGVTGRKIGAGCLDKDGRGQKWLGEGGRVTSQ